MPIDTIASATLAKHGVLAFFWAIVHALSAHRAGTSKSFLDFIVLVTMSSFTWVMFTLLALHFLPTAPYLAYAASGAGWYIGVEGMSFIVSIIKSKFK